MSSGYGQRCPSCGEYDVIFITHDRGEGEQDIHACCQNCDYGVCGEGC